MSGFGITTAQGRVRFPAMTCLHERALSRGDHRVYLQYRPCPQRTQPSSRERAKPRSLPCHPGHPRPPCGHAPSCARQPGGSNPGVRGAAHHSRDPDLPGRVPRSGHGMPRAIVGWRHPERAHRGRLSLSPGRPGRRRARPRPGFEPPSTELRPDDDGHRWSCGRGDLGGLRDSAPPFPASPPAGLGNARHPPKARNRAVRSDGCPGATEPSLGSLGGAIKVPSPSGRSCEMT